jgi:sulfite reductase (NADPH) flavoprotein alpha-component
MIHILWGSQTGNAANLAQVISDSLTDAGFETSVHDMGSVDPEAIHAYQTVIFVTSTYGDGEAPDNASEWLSFLKYEDSLKLDHLHYAVLGLGDPYYPHFCQCGKDFDQYLNKHGAKALLPRLDCDRYFEEQYPEWLNSLIQVLKTTEAD